MTIYKPVTDFYKTILLNKFDNLCRPLATNFGLDAFAYSSVTTDGYFYQISNVPDHAIMYWDIGLYEKNIFLQSPDSYQAGIYLLRAIPDNSFQQMLDSFNQKGMDWYLRIVRKENDVCHQFLFGSTIKNLPFNKLFFHNINLLQTFCDYFLEESREIVKHCDKFTFYLPDLLGEKYDCRLIRTAHGIDDETKNNFLRQIYKHNDDFYLGFCQLSRREMDCIKQFLEGKTARQIGHSLHISHRTVEHHLENIKSKLCCSSKLELFKKLQKYGRFII